MVQVDLITGFLGSGKTTFLRRYVQYLVAQGHSVCILENDFGAVNVDAMLLQDLIGEHCDIETISGGCDCDTHQRRMRTKLISMAMRGFDRVVIEPSGIFDVDEFYDILRTSRWTAGIRWAASLPLWTPSWKTSFPRRPTTCWPPRPPVPGLSS